MIFVSGQYFLLTSNEFGDKADAHTDWLAQAVSVVDSGWCTLWMVLLLVLPCTGAGLCWYCMVLVLAVFFPG